MLRVARGGEPRAMSCATSHRHGCPVVFASPCGRIGCARLCTPEGLEAAYQAHHGRMLSRARRVVVDPHLAEEAVQEAFVRAWRSCASFDPEGGPLVNWLVTIARNAAVDLAKARSRRPPVAPEPAATGRERVAEGMSDADRMLLRHELGHALASIGPLHREAVVEVILRDRPYAEVAAELGIPAGTLRSRVHYALRGLRDVLTSQAA